MGEGRVAEGETAKLVRRLALSALPSTFMLLTAMAALATDNLALLDLQALWFAATVGLVLWAVVASARRRIAALVVGALIVGLGFFLMTGTWVAFSGV